MPQAPLLAAALSASLLPPEQLGSFTLPRHPHPTSRAHWSSDLTHLGSEESGQDDVLVKVPGSGALKAQRANAKNPNWHSEAH